MLKSTTGIRGFDDIAAGGLPSARTALLTGRAGSGKTVFALQALVHAARDRGEPGIFVAFEKTPDTLKTYAQSFQWRLSDVPPHLLSFIDAQPNLDLERIGAFDVGGMLAMLQAKVQATGAKLIVFDAIDILLAQISDADVTRREIYRLQNWLSEAWLTAIITSKTSVGDSPISGMVSMEFVQYMVYCWVVLNNDIVDQMSQRNLRIAKYRGPRFHGNAVPLLIWHVGIDAGFTQTLRGADLLTSAERLSNGLTDLDSMLHGGYQCAACVLLAELPGTAKTSMCGAFVAAASARGERALFVSFVSQGDETIRNLRSMAINLQPYIASGLLRMVSKRASEGSAKVHLLSIRFIASDHNATCIVTDPLSALSKSGNRGTAPGVSERLIDSAKTDGRTVLCTSLRDNTEDPTEAAPLQISTIADTRIHRTNKARGGERNRTLSIIKSRGTGHSNQVRELVMLDDGLSLKDIFLGGGLNQMGPERLESEREEHLRLVKRTAEDAIGASRREAKTVHLQSQIVLFQGELRRKVAEDQAMRGRPASLAHEENAIKYHLRSIRGNSTNSGGTDNGLD